MQQSVYIICSYIINVHHHYYNVKIIKCVFRTRSDFFLLNVIGILLDEVGIERVQRRSQDIFMGEAKYF